MRPAGLLERRASRRALDPWRELRPRQPDPALSPASPHGARGRLAAGPWRRRQDADDSSGRYVRSFLARTRLASGCLCTSLYTHASMLKTVKAAVAGANGYAGMTLVNLLARHPGVQLAQLTSRSYAGRPYSEVFPLLDLKGEFRPEPDPKDLDVVFSCLPHNVGASKAAGWIGAGARVIDMSADFRLHDAKQYPTWYRQEHPAPELLAKAVFGLPELHAAELRDAVLVAVPGCYSTASILALAP